MKPELEGRGGGYGKFQGKTVGEIKELYARCEADPSMRSVSAVLRIAREQLDARGGLGYYPWYAAAAFGVVVVSFAAKPFLPEQMAGDVQKFQLGLGVVAFLLALGVALTAGDRKVALAQEEAIRVATRETLERILASRDFVRKPLDFTQNLTMQKVLEGAKDSPAAVLLGP